MKWGKWGVGEVVGWSVLIYSTAVRIRHKTKWKQANGDYYFYGTNYVWKATSKLFVDFWRCYCWFSTPWLDKLRLGLSLFGAVLDFSIWLIWNKYIVKVSLAPKYLLRKDLTPEWIKTQLPMAIISLRMHDSNIQFVVNTCIHSYHKQTPADTLIIIDIYIWIQ